jgi:hypothetical protein
MLSWGGWPPMALGWIAPDGLLSAISAVELPSDGAFLIWPSARKTPYIPSRQLLTMKSV